MNAQIRINRDTNATEIFTGDKWVATYVQEDIDQLKNDLLDKFLEGMSYARLLRPEVKLRGSWSEEYENGFWDGLEKYEELIFQEIQRFRAGREREQE